MADQEPSKHKQAAPENAPDPDEDELDDLDDVLDEFANTKLDSKSQAPKSSGPGRPTTDPEQLAFDDDFEKQLQQEMANLLGGADMQKEFEGMLKDLSEAAASSAKDAPDGAATATAPAESSREGNKAAQSKVDASFQETIRKTMERMQESGDQASAAASQPDLFSEDMISQFLAEMSKDGGGGEEGFAKMLTEMMEELTNKDVLYEPMKELNDKFPEWLEKNREKTSKDDLVRYEEQQRLVKEITDKFEEKEYSDKNPQYREYIVERMQKMQSVGSPPPDLIGNTNAAAEALAGMDEGCPQQ